MATITVQVVDQKGGHVTERITREDDRGFVHERLVDTTFAIRRFEDPVAIPGGYKLIELAPYGAQDAGLQPNRAWNAVAGDFSIPGGQGVAQRVRVIGRVSMDQIQGE